MTWLTYTMRPQALHCRHDRGNGRDDGTGADTMAGRSARRSARRLGSSRLPSLIPVLAPALAPALIPVGALNALAVEVGLGAAVGPLAMTADAGVRGRGSGAGPARGGTRPDDPESTRVAALVELAQAGDAEAFGQIYELYVDTVYRYVYVRVGSPTLAEDITAETFLRALRRIDSFTWQGRDIAAWFVTIARNLVTDHRRSSRFRLEVTTDELLGAEQVATCAGTTVPAPGPEQEMLSRARDRRLVDAVKTLRPDQQECLVLRFFQEFSVAETAKALGRSEGAVKQLQLRAVRSLAHVLGDKP